MGIARAMETSNQAHKLPQAPVLGSKYTSKDELEVVYIGFDHWNGFDFVNFINYLRQNHITN